MGFGPTVKEKLPEELYPCFRSDKGINHQVRLGLMSNKFTRSFRIYKFGLIIIMFFEVEGLKRVEELKG
jgi:hypothetical protein